MVKTAIIILNYKDQAVSDTLDCLDSLKICPDISSTLIILVVSQTTKEACSKLHQHQLCPYIIETDENLGFCKGNNLGMKEAVSQGAEVLILLNNDTVVDKDFVNPLVETALKKDAGLVSPKIYFAPSFEFHQDSYKKDELGKIIWYAGGIIDWQNVYGYHRGVDEYDHGQFNSLEVTDFATGCCLCTTKENYQKTGGFNPDYFLTLEDLDWSQRTKRLNKNNYYQPQSLIYHKNAKSSGGSGSDLQQYYQTRNRLLFSLKYAPIRSKLAVIKEAFRKYRFGTDIERIAITDFILHIRGEKNL